MVFDGEMENSMPELEIDISELSGMSFPLRTAILRAV